VGVMESIVAERLVNLTWRLERAQRMQNQSIDYLGLDELAGYRAEDFKSLFRKAHGLSHRDLEIPNDHLLLGRLATRDWAYSRVLDKMMLYERRIETSMYRAMHELEKLQEARKAEQAAATSSRGHLARDLGHRSETNARAVEQQSAQETSPARRDRGNLKKQSQFAPVLMGITSCAQKDYDDASASGRPENRANQSQTLVFGGACAPVKGEIAAALRASQ